LGSGPKKEPPSRKNHFIAPSFHAKPGRVKDPLVVVGDLVQTSFHAGLMRESAPGGSILQLGTDRQRCGHVTVEGMRFDSDQTGVAAIETRNIDPSAGIIISGCEFGTKFSVPYVARWGDQPYKRVEWVGNSVDGSKSVYPLYLGRPPATDPGALAGDDPTRPVSGYADTFRGTDLRKRSSGWAELSADGHTKRVLSNLPWNILWGRPKLVDGELHLPTGAGVELPSHFVAGKWELTVTELSGDEMGPLRFDFLHRSPTERVFLDLLSNGTALLSEADREEEPMTTGTFDATRTPVVATVSRNSDGEYGVDIDGGVSLSARSDFLPRTDSLRLANRTGGQVRIDRLEMR
jgi:hypothetical protein